MRMNPACGMQRHRHKSIDVRLALSHTCVYRISCCDLRHVVLCGTFRAKSSTERYAVKEKKSVELHAGKATLDVRIDGALKTAAMSAAKQQKWSLTAYIETLIQDDLRDREARQGNTSAEKRAAIHAMLESIKRPGTKMPVHVWIDGGLKAAALTAAKHDRRSLTAYIETLIMYDVQQRQARQKRALSRKRQAG